MSDRSDIEWTDATWNPVRGCTKISPGCKHCYAEAFAERFRGVPGHPYEQGFDLRLVPTKLTEPLSWKRPRKVFVNSMSDLFHEDVPPEYVAAVFGVMARAPHHQFQVLTKRPVAMLRWLEWLETRAREANNYFVVGHSWARYQVLTKALSEWTATGWEVPNSGDGSAPWRMWPWPLDNVFVGVSVENRRHGILRINQFRHVPAAHKFLSIEPLLEDIADDLDLSGIKWVIVGCERGPGARQHASQWESWVRRLRDRAVAQGVKFFYKQAPDVRQRGRVISLPLLDGRQWLETP